MLNFPQLGTNTFTGVTVRLILAATVAIFCAAQFEVCSIAQTQDLPEYSDPDGYLVLSALLSRGHSQYSPQGPVLLIFPQTSSGIDPDSFQSCKNIPAEFKKAAKDFELKNKNPLKVLNRFSLPFEYEIADPRKKPADPPVLPGEQPFEIPQRAVSVVSAVGFNPARDHAFAYLAGYAGPMAASGGYYLLVKNKYGWRVDEASPICEWMTRDMNDRGGRSFS